jgi:hypothetical protein
MRTLSLMTAAAFLTLGLAACTPTDNGPDLPPAASVPADDDQGTRPADDECGGISGADIASIVGHDLGEGEPDSGTVTVNDLTYSTTGCDWEDGDWEIDLDLSYAEHFDDDTVHCVEPLGIGHDVTPVEGLGSQAWWVDDDDDHAEGELFVCSDLAMVGVKIEAPDDQRDALQGYAEDIARMVVG